MAGNPYPDLFTDAEWSEIDRLEAVHPGMGIEMQVKNLCRELGPVESLRRLKQRPKVVEVVTGNWPIEKWARLIAESDGKQE